MCRKPVRFLSGSEKKRRNKVCFDNQQNAPCNLENNIEQGWPREIGVLFVDQTPVDVDCHMNMQTQRFHTVHTFPWVLGENEDDCKHQLLCGLTLRKHSLEFAVFQKLLTNDILLQVLQDWDACPRLQRWPDT